MRDGDAILCFNFRADRVREILAALLDPAFDRFPRPRRVNFCAAVGLTHYSDELATRMATVFPPVSMARILGELVSQAGLHQLRMAETEKYPHVTYFLNGGREQPYPGEDRTMVPSPKVATYDLQPEMSEPELAEKAVAAIGSGKYDLIVLNFANPDMVGHTGNLEAAIKAVESTDAALGQVVDAVARARGVALITADHGNAEFMADPKTGQPHTAHTTFPVPLILLDPAFRGRLRSGGTLADVAPTLLGMLGVKAPPEMTGRDLRINN
jgi:2,3-bisphosphoglycerate-independent phosphoglycerate mutase